MLLNFLSSTKEMYYTNQEGYNSALEQMYENSKQIMENANDALSQMDSVYSTLKSAANEYANSGFINSDTYQDILGLGVEYLAMLKDENGQLVINEDNINKIIKARIQQVGIETSLNYVEQLRMALLENNTDTLNNLLNATNELTDSTWDLVYAELATLNLSTSEFNAAVQRINTIRGLTDTAISGVGQTTNTIIDGLNDTSDALDSILQYVIEMIKQETENQIDALEEQISDYQKIVDLKKEALQTTKEEDDYNKSVADKLKEMSELEAQINQLSLDDSREAQVEKKSLEEELAELQEELSDEQADHAYDATVDSLDKMAEAYEEEKNDEITVLQESISSYQKLYDLAIARIEEEGRGLLSQLLSWNEEYGSDLNSTIVEAWKNAKEALSDYNYEFEKAQKSVTTKIEASDNEDNTVVGKTYTSKSNKASSSGSIAGTNSSADSTYTSKERNISLIVAAMKQNSAAWRETNDADKRAEYEAKNNQYGHALAALGLTVEKDSSTGVWYIGYVGGEKLYDKYHTGGVVGRSDDLKQNEVVAVLEKGEIVLDKKKENNLYKTVDFVQMLSEKLGTTINMEKFNKSVWGVSLMPKVSDLITTTPNAIDNSKYVIEHMEVTAPIQVSEKLDKSDIEEHSKLIGEVASNYIMEGFTKRGKKSGTSLF